jgi:para-nitrobenzyl esterase
MPRPRSVLLGALVGGLLASFTVAAPAAAGQDPSLVRTDRGVVRGVATAAGRTFLAIPYAAAPVGDLRWSAPRPAAAWTDVRDATAPGPACAQAGLPEELGNPRSTTEDCLYLNVYTPAGRPRHRPVMVWFPGGGFIAGSANQYDGAALARRGTVVVTVNYRLGAFGFLAHRQLSGEQPRLASGNYGILDQQAALRWVQRNAPAFGGDPRRVTVFGESAGGLSVCAHLTSPLAAGLFDRAIVQSGPCTLMHRPLGVAEAAGQAFAARAGCGTAVDVPACLRALPPGGVLDAMGTPSEAEGLTWSPTSGTPVLPVDPARAIAAGSFHRVPVIAGTTRDEGRIFAALVEAAGVPVNAATYPLVLAQYFGADAARVAAEYPGSAYGGDYRLALGAVLTDAQFACPTLAMNRALTRATRTYAYEFADRTAPNIYPLNPDFPLGAYHGSELPYLFPPDGLPFDAAQRMLSDRMLAYWTRFAAAGTPNPAGTTHWRQFQPTRPNMLTLERGQIQNRTDFTARHHCGFWTTIGT